MGCRVEAEAPSLGFLTREMGFSRWGKMDRPKLGSVRKGFGSELELAVGTQAVWPGSQWPFPVCRSSPGSGTAAGSEGWPGWCG